MKFETELPSFRLSKQDLQDLILFLKKNLKVGSISFTIELKKQSITKDLEEILKDPTLPDEVHDFSLWAYGKNGIVSIYVSGSREDSSFTRVMLETPDKQFDKIKAQVMGLIQKRKNKNWIFHTNPFSYLPPVSAGLGLGFLIFLKEIGLLMGLVGLFLFFSLSVSLLCMTKFLPYSVVELREVKRTVWVKLVILGIATSIIGGSIILLFIKISTGS